MTRWAHAAVYARVSKKDHQAGQTVEQQLEALEAWVKPQAGALWLYAERASTLKVRPVLADLRRRIGEGEHDALIVWKLDRIARDVLELEDWRMFATERGFDLVSFTQGADLRSPEGRLMFRIFSAIGQYERDQIGQRTKAKLDYIRKHEGRVPGRNGRAYDPGRAAALHGTMPTRKLAAELGVAIGTADRLKRRLSAEEAREKQRTELLRTAGAAALTRSTRAIGTDLSNYTTTTCDKKQRRNIPQELP